MSLQQMYLAKKKKPAMIFFFINSCQEISQLSVSILQ